MNNANINSIRHTTQAIWPSYIYNCFYTMLCIGQRFNCIHDTRRGPHKMPSDPRHAARGPPFVHPGSRLGNYYLLLLLITMLECWR